MKKVLILICIILTIFNITSVHAESCAGGHGTIQTGINGKKYCASKNTLNWWSAHAWCRKAEGFSELLTMEDCDCTGYDECDTTLSCPNLKNIYESWSGIPAGKDNAYYFSYGAVKHPGPLGRYRNWGGYRALCK